MKENIRALTDFAVRALAAERMSAAGRVNMFGMVTLLVVMTGSALANIAQIIGRTFDSKYDVGAPSIIALSAIYVGLTLACTAIVGLLDR